MRTVRFIIMSVSTAVVLSLGLTASTHAEVDEGELKAVYPNLIVSKINVACPKGSQKVIIAKFSVPRQTRIKEFGEFYLELKNGNFLVDSGYKVDRRHVEYYLFPRSRRAKVLVNDYRDTLLYAAYTSHTYTLALSSDCQEKFPDME